MEVKGFNPHKGQLRVIDAIINHPAKYVTVVSPRQQGKSLLLINLILYFAINDKKSKIGVVTPIYAQARKLMEDLYEAIKDSGIIKSINFSNKEITLKTNSKIYFRSSENEDGLRGYTFNYLFLDEASYQSEDAWKRALQPTVLVHGKKAMLFSTPRGRDWFYNLYQMGQDPDYKEYYSVRMEQGDNPYINQEEIDAAKKILPEAIFRAEYLGEFIEGESQVFTNYQNCTYASWPKQAQGKVFVAADLGRENDYTVAIAMDQSGNVLEIYRENQKDWEEMQKGILALTKKWNATLMVESNSMGTVIYENLKRQWQDTHPFATTSQSKKDIVERLILAFNEEKVSIPDKALMPELHQELDMFEMSYNPKTRNVKYAARPPFHDDMVMALCIVNYNRETNQSLGNYYVLGKR